MPHLYLSRWQDMMARNNLTSSTCEIMGLTRVLRFSQPTSFSSQPNQKIAEFADFGAASFS
jgi:hypothetical protein